MNKKDNHPLIVFSISLKSYILISIALIALIVSLYICTKPMIAELAYRKAYFISEYSLKQPKYFSRYKYAIEEYEKASRHYPWETHYTVMMNKDIERYLAVMKDSNEKLKLINKALNSYATVQQLDPVNPWYYSRISALQNRLAFELRDSQPKLAKNILKDASENTRKAAQIDYENPIFLENYANFLDFNKRYTEALYYYKKCTEIDKNYFNSNMKMASIYISLKHYELALNAYKNAKKTIVSYLRLPKSHKLYKKAVKYKDINYKILKLLIKMKDYNQALAYFNDHNKDDHTTIKFSGLGGYLFYLLNDYRKSYILLDYFYNNTEDNIYIQLYTDLLVQVNSKDKIIKKLSRILNFKSISEENKKYVQSKLNAYK
tara:strand:- start:203 stop:1330 length:1128 start_codon:yes stop_codon:yes gene_type:complete